MTFGLLGEGGCPTYAKLMWVYRAELDSFFFVISQRSGEICFSG